MNMSTTSTSEHPNISVLSPNGGEVWRAGEMRYITWTVDADLYQGIEYFALDDTGHSTGDTLLTDIEPDIHTYQWTVPDIDCDQMIMRVWGHPADSGETFSDDSDGYFTILPRLTQRPGSG